MRAVVVGYGKFGSSVTDLLLQDGHDVVVIDRNQNVINEINDTRDVLAVCANAADYDVLKDIGMKSVDVCISCTAVDEINVLVCAYAKAMGAKQVITSIRNQKYESDGVRFLREHFGIDIIINPDHITAEAIYDILAEEEASDVIIVGGSRIAGYLSEMLVKQGVAVKILEKYEEKSIFLSNHLPDDVIVICADGANHENLVAEGIDNCDAFVALTNTDEENILTSLLASEHNVRTIVTKINKYAYTDIISGLNLPHVISPRNVTSEIAVKSINAQ